MVDQRRISISPHTGGIRNSELKLVTWWNYLYIWVKFHWKITGVSKIRITDTSWSSDISWSADLQIAWSDNNKATISRIIVISGNLGTLKDRWNFWTFGIKVYKQNRKHSIIKNRHTHSLKYAQITPIRLNRKLVVSSKLPAKTNSKRRGATPSKGIKELYTQSIAFVNHNKSWDIFQQVNGNDNRDNLQLAKQARQINWKGIIGKHC